ncbi:MULTISPECIES: hypothetical protein [Prochlorococcus]|uniref:hypothetical protein n=1 Tax=Prochlorococcus TaxID=1218 RepID=UPI000533B0AB|nr:MULTISPECIES: hypothetical protein [Prochlorococcus]KGG12378.1 ABC-type sugar transport system [Prochlorococcus sp. MIT 0601]
MYLLIPFILILLLEISHALAKKSSLAIYPSKINLIFNDNQLAITGIVNFSNNNKRIELMVPKFSVKPNLLAKDTLVQLDQFNITTKVNTSHIDAPNRMDNYWQAYIVKSKSSTQANFTINIKSNTKSNLIESIDVIWVELDWIEYGPSGYNKYKKGFTVPLNSSNNSKQITVPTYKYDEVIIQPIKTHILGLLDDPIDILNRYTSNLTNPGDLIIIGETPLAIMQGRYFLPEMLETGLLSKILCRAFHPTSSLATACGMQTLINDVGPTRVIAAWFIGAVFKLANIKGIFYRLAGKQARLIDDITGTTPPYDQTIVLGPNNPENFCRKATEALGLDVSVVDVNDLGKVKVLATSNPRLVPFLKHVLTSNPAGNGDEKTPLLILRPLKDNLSKKPLV